MSRGTEFWDQLDQPFVVDQNLLNAGGASILLCLCFSQVGKRRMVVRFMVGVNKKTPKRWDWGNCMGYHGSYQFCFFSMNMGIWDVFFLIPSVKSMAIPAWKISIPTTKTGPWRQLWVAPSSLGPMPLTSWMLMICAQYIEVGPGGLGPRSYWWDRVDQLGKSERWRIFWRTVSLFGIVGSALIFFFEIFWLCEMSVIVGKFPKHA